MLLVLASSSVQEKVSEMYVTYWTSNTFTLSGFATYVNEMR